jgi:hypothetical protein
VTRTEDEVNEQVNAASEAMDTNGSRWPGMSYEQGVDAALRWVMGWSDDKPMEDE